MSFIVYMHCVNGKSIEFFWYTIKVFGFDDNLIFNLWLDLSNYFHLFLTEISDF